MTRFRGLVAVVVGLASVGGVWAEDKKEQVKFDASKLEGKWMVKEFVKGGEKQDTAELKDPVVFTKDTITVGSSAGEFKFKYTLDAKADPVAIDMEITAPEGLAGAKAMGILKLDGDKLMFTYDSNPESKDRPAKFESAKESMVNSFVLTRAKDEKKDK